MTTYAWEKKESAGSWVPFEGTPTAQNPTEDFDDGTWSVRVTATEGASSNTKTRNAYVTVSAAPAYTGPLDLVPGAVVAYSSARALSAAMCGQNGYTLYAVDTTELAFAYNASTGEIDSAAISTWIAAHGAAASVKRLEDHSGNGLDLTSGGVVAYPQWYANVQNSKPGLGDGDENAGQIVSDGIAEVALANGAYTVFMVFKGNTSFQITDPDTSSYAGVSPTHNGAAGSLFAEVPTNYAGGTDDSTLANAVHVLDGAWQFGSRSMRINGAARTLISDDSGGALGSFTGYADFYIASADDRLIEVIMYPMLLSDGNRTTIRQNIATFFNITLS